jgi:radical SAM-linked protein
MTQHETERITARVEYAKLGRLRFIGHLDTTRLITRAVRMARLPVRYTQGCSPHLEVSFGPPLAVGCTGGSEFFDLKLSGSVDPDAARDALQAHVPDGIQVRSVQLTTGKTESLGASINRADYVVELPKDVAVETETIRRFLDEKEIIVTRHRDDRQKPVNVRRFVERLAIAERENGTRVEMTIIVTPEGSTNPAEVLEALGIDPNAATRIHRTRTYHAADTDQASGA